MATTRTPHDQPPAPSVSHYVDDAELELLLEHDHDEREADRRALPRLLVACCVAATTIAVIALITAIFGLAADGDGASTSAAAAPAMATMDHGTAAGATRPAPTIAQAKGVKFESYQRPDPALPPVPAGPLKKFRVTVDEHVTQVAKTLAPTQVWSFGVNGKSYPGTGTSTPIVVDEGDRVEIVLDNAGTKGMQVAMPHSIDFHSAEVAPNVDYTDIKPGETKGFTFVAKHPGVYMYHCATRPILMHTGAGMTGMMVVRPKGLPAAKELWLTQQEFYIGTAGGLADLAKIKAKTPDVIAFNGYADQYKQHPISVRRGERIRLYVLNGGVSTWSAFHVIGTVFDSTHVEGVVGADSQTINLAPSQGGWVDFTLDKEGNYPFVTHAFGDMVKGAAGILHTTNAPMPKGAGH